MKRLTLLLLLAFMVFAPAQAQAPGLVNMNVSIGYAGRFRDNAWTPVQVSLENNSTRAFSGELITRPERSRGVTNPVSTPVSLAPGSRQVFTLYISLRSFAETVRIELLAEDGSIAAEVESSVSAVLTRERLYVRVSNGIGRPINLKDAASFGQSVAEADWFVNNIPDREIGLEAVDLMVISNADTGELTPQQRTAIHNWVLGGGQLVVTGGTNWEQTAAGIESLLPFQPDSSALSSDFGTLKRLAGEASDLAATETVLARGTLTDDAMVLASDSDGAPLVARRTMGYGLVDYLTFDPTTAPFSAWNGTNKLWFSLVSSRDVRPGWSYGFLNLSQGYDAVEILPGVTALPEALTMIAFLLLYILLIGPINYLLLSRIGRRELAWFTIPAMIVVFTIIAWVTGFNLRGTEVVLSRLSVVESWPQSDSSHVRQLIGLLSPRRTNYNLTLPDSRSLRPLLRTTQSGFFSPQASNIEIMQSDVFNAVDFPVDASFMAGFITDGMTARAPLSGSISIIEKPNGRSQLWRGSIRNDLPVPLTNVILLSRSGVIRLDEPLAAGEIRVLEQDVAPAAYMPIPAAPIEYISGFFSPGQNRSYTTRGRSLTVGPEQTLKDVIGDEAFRSSLFFGMPAQSTPLSQSEQREQTFLSNFMIDQFNSTARGDNIYLLGWTDQAPFDEEINGASWKAVDTTLYITTLETNIQPESDSMRTRIFPDQFTWTLVNDEAASNSTPNFINYLTRDKLAFRLTPVPSSVLETVDSLVVILEYGTSSLNNTAVRLMNWRTGRYEPVSVTGQRTTIANPADYIGPNNAVEIEIDRMVDSGALSVTNIAVEQYGTRKS